MSEQAANAVRITAQSSAPADSVSASVKQLFMALHGCYGSVFLSKFSTGDLDERGKDRGIRSAMQVWQGVLAGIPADVVQAAVQRAFSAHPEFPPSLAQFAAICSAVMPRKTYAEEAGLPALPPPTPAAPVAPSAYSFTHMKDGRDWARRILAGVEAGEKRTSTVVRFARQALGLEA